MKLSRDEEQAFLAETRVAMFGVTEPARGPLLNPIWYRYEPGGVVEFTVAATARKLALLREAGRASLCVQSDVWPYRYVSVEGPAEIHEPRPPELVEALAVRYLGEQAGREYARKTTWPGAHVVLHPELWRSVTFAAE